MLLPDEGFFQHGLLDVFPMLINLGRCEGVVISLDNGASGSLRLETKHFIYRIEVLATWHLPDCCEQTGRNLAVIPKRMLFIRAGFSEDASTGPRVMLRRIGKLKVFVAKLLV